MKNFDSFSRRNALGVAREEGALANVLQAEIQHDETLEAHSASGVRRTAVAKRVNVILDRLGLITRETIR